MGIEYDKNVTPEELTKVATDIWRFVLSNKPATAEQMTEDWKQEMMNKCLEKWRDFLVYYAIIVRYMVDFGMFYDRLFLEFAYYIQKNPWKTEKEKCDRMSWYIRRLHNAYFPNDKKGEIFEEQISRSLYSEIETFRETLDKSQKNLIDGKKELLMERIKQLPEDEVAKLIQEYEGRKKM